MISAQGLFFSHGARSIFEDAHFSVADNYKVGLVGVNGAGKSTLLGLILGREQPDQGKLEINGSIGLVPQEVKHDPEMEKANTVRDYLDPTVMHEDFELRRVLDGLELPHLALDASAKKLSGGQKTKLALARALLMQPDILLLDEPTNFLDIAGKQWVMDFLSRYPKTLIIISHDLDLLDKQIQKVLFIDPFTKKIDEYSGNYSAFLKLKAEREALFKRQVTNQQKRIKKMEESVKKLMKNKSDKGVRQRVILQRRVARMKAELPELPPELAKIKIEFPTPAACGELVLKAEKITKKYGENQVLKDVSLAVIRGERIALLGRNGAGKSTLLKIMMGILEADSGTVTLGSNVKIGYYSQEFETFDLDKTVLEAVQEEVHLPDYYVRPMLQKFMFEGVKADQKISTLSGGEKTRLAILTLMLHDYNLLILDEPTTYLDVLSQRIILDALKQYQGTMVVVSHTETFIAELIPSRALLLPDNYLDIWSENFLNKVSEI